MPEMKTLTFDVNGVPTQHEVVDEVARNRNYVAYGPEDLVDRESPLPAGTFYFRYEV